MTEPFHYPSLPLRHVHLLPGAEKLDVLPDSPAVWIAAVYLSHALQNINI